METMGNTPEAGALHSRLPWAQFQRGPGQLGGSTAQQSGSLQFKSRV